MRRLTIAVAIALAVTSGSPLLAQEPASATEVAAAREMLAASRSRENFVRAMELGIEQGGAEMTPAVRAVFRDFMAEHFSYDELEPEFIRVYTELFTEEEMRSFSAFYETPAGRRMAELTPELQVGIQRLTNDRMQALMPELVQRMMAAMDEDGGQP